MIERRGWTTGRWVVAGFAIATFVGSLYGAQRAILRYAREQPLALLETVGVQMVPWYAWVVLLPAVLWVCRRTSMDPSERMIGIVRQAAYGVGFAALHVALCVVPIGVLSHWTTVNLPVWIGWQQLALNRGVLSWTEYVMIAAIIHVVLLQARVGERDLQAASLRAQLGDAELRALRMQLEPHFLFNTLNAIHAYVRAAPETAESMLGHLSAVLRRVLEGRAQALTPLSDELDLVRRYLAIHEVRFGARLHTGVTSDPRALSVVVPTLILQPLVENAIAHGVSKRPGPVRVEIDVRWRDDHVEIVLIDGVVIGESEKSAGHMVITTSGLGVGLENTKQRLAYHYGPRATLTIRVHDHETCLTLRLPIVPLPPNDTHAHGH